MSIDSKGCRDCIYHGYSESLIICEYIRYTHSRRPCPAGSKCTVRVTKACKAEEAEKVEAEKAKTSRNRRKWDVSLALRMYRSGSSDKDIAKAVGTTRTAVTSWRQVAHLPTIKKAAARAGTSDNGKG